MKNRLSVRFIGHSKRKLSDQLPVVDGSKARSLAVEQDAVVLRRQDMLLKKRVNARRQRRKMLLDFRMNLGKSNRNKLCVHVASVTGAWRLRAA